MKILKATKRIFLLTVIYIFIFEALFQILFIFNLKFISKPMLYYNGYCDQKYWDMQNNKVNNNFEYHSILSYKKKNIFIPNKFDVNNISDQETSAKKAVAIYGSSYMNHLEVEKILKNNKDVNFTNYALDSYGLDQIFLSYKLTASLNKNKTIVFGFLLEDLDRSIFKFREYQKALFENHNGKFKLTNIPIDQNVVVRRNHDFYLYKFIKNFYDLISNDFDPRLDTCKIKYKKKLFSYFFEEIKKISIENNQNIIVVTFNLQEDITKKYSWRYSFINEYLQKNNVTHIDSAKIITTKLSKQKDDINTYFGTDMHNNKKSFDYIFSELFKFL